MDFHGDFMTGDKEWNCQARLEEEIAEHLNKRRGISLANSTIRHYVGSALEKWRVGRK
jgi:hypothetical protein